MSLLDKKSSIKTDAIFSNKKDIELYDAELWESFEKEMVRQEEHIELIASENYGHTVSKTTVNPFPLNDSSRPPIINIQDKHTYLTQSAHGS